MSGSARSGASASRAVSVLTWTIWMLASAAACGRAGVDREGHDARARLIGLAAIIGIAEARRAWRRPWPDRRDRPPGPAKSPQSCLVEVEPGLGHRIAEVEGEAGVGRAGRRRWRRRAAGPARRAAIGSPAGRGRRARAPARPRATGRSRRPAWSAPDWAGSRRRSAWRSAPGPTVELQRRVGGERGRVVIDRSGRRSSAR